MIEDYIVRKIPIKILAWLIKSKFGNKDLRTFTRLLDSDQWTKVSRSPEKWIFSRDNSFVIEEGSEVVNFTEEWIQNFHDIGASWKDVYLKVSSELIQEPIKFVSVDGGRYFVPLPKLDESYGETYRYWDRSSVDYKVYKIIGWLNGADINDDNKFNSFAKRCGILVK